MGYGMLQSFSAGSRQGVVVVAVAVARPFGLPETQMDCESAVPEISVALRVIYAHAGSDLSLLHWVCPEGGTPLSSQVLCR